MGHPSQLSRASGYYFSEKSACFSEIVVYFLALHRYNLSKKGVPYDGLRTARSAFRAKRRRPQNRAGFGKRHCQAHFLCLRQAAGKNRRRTAFSAVFGGALGMARPRPLRKHGAPEPGKAAESPEEAFLCRRPVAAYGHGFCP